MIYRAILTAVVAGLVAGLVVSGLQALTTVPLILEAESFEQVGALAPAHSHDAEFATSTGSPGDRQTVAGHEHGENAWAPEDGWERTGYTILANILIAIGYGALLAGAFTILSRQPTLTQSLAWGIAGFAAFSFIPSLGLPPELPGMITTDVEPRQLWWWGSAIANCAGLAAIFIARQTLWKILGGVVIAAPFLIGAPNLGSGAHAGSVPPELAAEFATLTLGTGLLFWLTLAACAAFMFARLSGKEDGLADRRKNLSPDQP